MTSQVDRAAVVGAFDTALFPEGREADLDVAWLGIYQTLWWYEHGVLHVREANDLKKAIWRRRAEKVESYIAGELDLPVDQMPRLMDRMMHLPRWHGMQRNNPLGHGLRILLSELMTRHANPLFAFPEESDARLWFPGIRMPGRSETPRVDVAAVRNSDSRPHAILSCKWSIRHDRISDPTNEATQYKSAAIQQQVMDLRYYVITNELDIKRLEKIIDQPAVDGLVHVHLPAVRQVRDLSPSLERAVASGRLYDLRDFVLSTAHWT